LVLYQNSCMDQIFFGVHTSLYLSCIVLYQNWVSVKYAKTPLARFVVDLLRISVVQQLHTNQTKGV